MPDGGFIAGFLFGGWLFGKIGFYIGLFLGNKIKAWFRKLRHKGDYPYAVPNLGETRVQSYIAQHDIKAGDLITVDLKDGKMAKVHIKRKVKKQ